MVRSGVGRSKDLPYEAQLDMGRSKDLPYEAQLDMGGSKDLPYERYWIGVGQDFSPACI
jgi:hypothetical protein